MHYLDLLQRFPGFRKLWLAQVISLTGDWFSTVAIVALITRLTESGMAVGGLFLARTLPPFFASPVAGLIADRLPRKAILIASNLLRAVLVLGFLLVRDAETLWLLYTLTVFQFAASAFFEPAQNAMVPGLVPADKLVTANTMTSITWSAMLTIGAAVGGAVTALLGVEAALIIDAATFVVASALVLGIDYAPIAVPGHEGGGLAEIAGGLRYALARPADGAFVLIKGLGQFGSVDVLAALFASTVFIIGPEGSLALGLMFSAHGLGAVLGPLILDWLGDGSMRWLNLGVIIGMLTIPLSFLWLGLAGSLPIVLLAMVLRGMGGSINWTNSTILIQRTAPGPVMGRMFALDFAFFTLMQAGATLFAGFAVDALGWTPRELAWYVGLFSLLPLLGWSLTAGRAAFRRPDGA